MSAKKQADGPTLPAREESEKAILGACLVDESLAVRLRNVLPLDAFTVPAHVSIWQAMVDMVDNGCVIDAATLADELHNQRSFRIAGGPAYLDQLIEAMPFELRWSHDERKGHADLLLEAMRLRRSWHACEAVKRDICGGKSPDDVSAALSKAARIASASQVAVSRGDAIRRLRSGESGSAGSIWLPVRGAFNAALGHPEDDLGWKLRPLALGNYLALAGETSVGKTAALCSWVLALALDGVPCAILTLEDSDENIEARIIAAWSGIETWRIETNRYDQPWQASVVDGFAEKLSHLPIWTVWLPSAGKADVGSAIREQIASNGVRAVGLDYIQKVAGREDRSKNDQVESALGEMARALGKDSCAIVASQITRQGAKSGDPTVHDLRDSGTIGERARKVLVLSRGSRAPTRTADGAEEGFRDVWINVCKNSGGALGKVRGTLWPRQSLLWPGTRKPDWSTEPVPSDDGGRSDGDQAGGADSVDGAAEGGAFGVGGGGC